MFQLTLEHESIKDYLDWVKLLITIESAAVAALLYKTDESLILPWQLKFSAFSFVLSMLLLLTAYAGLVEHRRRHDETVRKVVAIPLLSGWTSFFIGFCFMVAAFV